MEPLLSLLAEELPLGFLENIWDAREHICKESYERAYSDTVWGDAEAHYILPHFRRALFEPVFRNSATKNKLIVAIERNLAKNYEYTLVRAGQLVLTASHVKTGGKLPRPALFRAHYASVNHVLSNPRLPFLEGPPKELYKRGEKYALILHGEDSRDASSFGFLRFAFPSTDLKQWLGNYDFLDVLSLVKAQGRQEQDVRDQAHPRIKRKKQEEGEEQ
jgi:hypothetical protein